MPLPEARPRRAVVEVVEVGVEVALVQLAHAARRPSVGRVDAVGDRPGSPCGAMPSQVAVGGLRRGAGSPRWRRSSDAARRPSCRTGSGRRRRPGRAPARARWDRQRRRPPASGAGDAPDQVRVEALVARRDRRVDREHAVRADLRRGASSSDVARAQPARAPARTSRNAEWPSLRCHAAGSMPSARSARTPPTPSIELLVEPHLAAADVQDVRDRPVRLVVLRAVRVQQQHAARGPTWTAHTSTLHVAPGQLDGDRQRLAVSSERPAGAAGGSRS